MPELPAGPSRHIAGTVSGIWYLFPVYGFGVSLLPGLGVSGPAWSEKEQEGPLQTL